MPPDSIGVARCMPAGSIVHIAKYPARKQSVEFSSVRLSVPPARPNHPPAHTIAEIATPPRQQWRHSGALSSIVAESYETHLKTLAATKTLPEAARPGKSLKQREPGRLTRDDQRQYLARAGVGRPVAGEVRRGIPDNRYCGSLMT